MSEVFKLEFSLSLPDAEPTIHVFAKDKDGGFHIYRREHRELLQQEFFDWSEYLLKVDENAYKEFVNWYGKYDKYMLPQEHAKYLKHFKDLSFYVNKPLN